MNRAILVALGTGAIISSAAALSIGTASFPTMKSQVAHDDLERSRIQLAAREAQRDAIETRYLNARAQCDALNGSKRDNCLIAAHAYRGRTLLEAQDPYAGG